MPNHSTAPTIGEATMTQTAYCVGVDHVYANALASVCACGRENRRDWRNADRRRTPSSVDALSDDEVNERLRTALGEPLFCGYPPGYSSNETIFAHHVIPALDERGLGVKYTEALEKEMERASGYEGPPGYRAFCWDLIKAPLSLRSRAALSVLQSQESNG